MDSSLQQSKQWTSPDECAQRRRKRFMATVSWNSQGIIFNDYLEKERTITGITMPIYCADSWLNWWKIGPIWGRRKCSFTMTTQQLTHPQLPQQNWSNYATNCCLIQPILQICSQTWKNSFVESASRQTMKSSPQQKSTLRSSTNHIFWMAWKS